VVTPPNDSTSAAPAGNSAVGHVSHAAEVVLSSEMLLAELFLWPGFAEILAASDLFVIGSCCTEFGCNRVASRLCYWPGAVTAKCIAHYEGWTHVAQVMGFVLAAEPLEVRQRPELDPTAARFAAMELY
jgi:hypothetical protein